MSSTPLPTTTNTPNISIPSPYDSLTLSPISSSTQHVIPSSSTGDGAFITYSPTQIPKDASNTAASAIAAPKAPNITSPKASNSTPVKRRNGATPMSPASTANVTPHVTPTKSHASSPLISPPQSTRSTQDTNLPTFPAVPPLLKKSSSLTDTSLDANPICGTIWMQNKTLTTIKKYKKRFLVLQHKKLQIFKTDLEFKPRFTIHLTNATIIPTKPKKFHIQTSKKTFKFKCVSEEQRSEWLDYLCREQSEKNAEQMREGILRRILAWNEEQQKMQFSIQQKKRKYEQLAKGGLLRSGPMPYTGSATNAPSATDQASLSALHFCPISITGLREIHKSMELLQFLTHEELYCVLTKTLRDLTLVSHKQVTVSKIQIALTGYPSTTTTDDKSGIESYVDDRGELLLVIREGFLYPKQEVLEKLLTWRYEPSAQLKSWVSKLTEIFDAKPVKEAPEDAEGDEDTAPTAEENEDEEDSDADDMVGQFDNGSSYTLGSPLNRRLKGDSPHVVDVKFAITESDSSLNEQHIEENLSRLTQHFRNMKERDSYVFKLSAELLGSIVVTNNSVSFFSRRGEVIIENFSTNNQQLPSLLVNNQRIMDLVLRHKMSKLEEILADLSMKSESVCGRKIIFALGGDIRARAAARVSSPRPVHPNETTINGDLSSDDRIQLAFVQLIQRLINEVPHRYRLKVMKNIDEVVISMQTTKMQENLLVDGVLENKGRFQLSADELKQTLKQMHKHNTLAQSLVGGKHNNQDTTSETTTLNRDSLSESSEHLSENAASLDLSNDDDEHVHAHLKKNFSKQFSLSEREVDQIVSEALKQLRKMWQQPQHEFQLERFIHDYIELVDLDQSLVGKLQQMVLDRKRTLNQNKFEFRTVALCLLSETLPQIVQDNLSRRRDIVLFGLKSSGKSQLLYKLKFNKNIKTSPSVGIQQEVVAFQDLNLMIYDVGGQTKEKDALKFFAKHRHEKVDGLIFMIDAVTFMSNKEQVCTLLLRYVKKVMKINNAPSSQTVGGENAKEAQSTQGQPTESHHTPSSRGAGGAGAHPSPPLLILLNKIDQPNTVNEKTVEHQMELALQKLTSKYGIIWKIQPTSVLRGDGLYEGLSYLTSLI